MFSIVIYFLLGRLPEKLTLKWGRAWPFYISNIPYDYYKYCASHVVNKQINKYLSIHVSENLNEFMQHVNN